MKLALLFLYAEICFIIGAAAPIWFNAKVHYAVSLALALLPAWFIISRTIEKSQLVSIGIIYDSLMTITYIIVPLIILKQSLSETQIFGIIITLIGLLILKS